MRAIIKTDPVEMSTFNEHVLEVDYHESDTHEYTYITTENAWVRFTDDDLDELILRLQFIQRWRNDPEFREQYPNGIE